MMRRYEQHHIDGDRVYRFVYIERLMHWVNDLSFFVLAISGSMMLFRNRFSLSEDSVSFIHWFHGYVGVVWFFGPALVFLIGDWRSGLHWIGECFRWTFSEILWLMGAIPKILFRRMPDPIVGRFNAGQRLNMLGNFLGKWGLAITGYFMQNDPGRLLVYDFHVILFFLLALLVTGHIYMGLINPSTRHSRFAMLSGFVNLEWLEHHHPDGLKSSQR